MSTSHPTDPSSASSELEASRVRSSNAARARMLVKCDSCGTPATSWCNGCYTVVYCDAACQRAEWPTHKALCKATRPFAAINERAATACVSGVASEMSQFVAVAGDDTMLKTARMQDAVAAVDAAFGVRPSRDGAPHLLLEGPGGEAPPPGLTPAQHVERYVRGLACVDDDKNMQANAMFNKIMRAAQRSLGVVEYNYFIRVLKERRIGSFNRP